MRLRRETGDFSVTVTLDSEGHVESVSPAKLAAGLTGEDFVGIVLGVKSVNPVYSMYTVVDEVTDAVAPGNIPMSVIMKELTNNIMITLNYNKNTGDLTVPSTP